MNPSFFLLILLVFLNGCKNGDGGAFSESGPSIEKNTIIDIVVKPAVTQIPKGLESSFNAYAVLSDGSIVDIKKYTSWSSEFTDIADSFNKGRSNYMKGLEIGSTTITASASIDGEVFSADATLNVTGEKVESLVLTPTYGITPLGLTRQFTATAYLTAGSFLDVTDNYLLDWGSSNTDIATIQSPGEIKTNAIGNARITALASIDGENYSADADLVVTEQILSSLEIAPTVSTIPIGLTQQFTITALLSDGSSFDVTNHEKLNWSSSNTDIATIQSPGKIKSEAVGTATITASASVDGDTFSVQTKVVTTDSILLSVEIDSSSVLPLYLTTPIAVKAILSDGTVHDVTNDSLISLPNYDGTDDRIITFTNENTIRGLKYGKAPIVATYKGHKADTYITVTSGICGHELGENIGTQDGGGINDTKDNAKGNACIKVAEGTYDNKTYYFTAPPSKEFVESTGLFIVDNSSNNSGNSVGSYYAPGEHPDDKFANFRADGLGVNYPTFKDSQSDRWCQNLKRVAFAGKTDWRTPSQDELEGLIAGQNMGEIFNWASGHNWTASTCSSTNGFWAVNNRGSNPVKSCYVSTSRAQRAYSSCVSEQTP